MRGDSVLQAHTWLAEHPEEGRRFEGEYIAVVEQAIVAHGPDVKQVYAEAIRYGSQPLIAKVRQHPSIVKLVR